MAGGSIMKVLMIGGTGTISMAITRLLCQSGWEVYLLNRGSRREEMPASVHWIQADMISPPKVSLN